MNWEAIGAVGEAVGAIGVIATLVYLAAQIRQNSNVVRSATRQAVSTAQMDIGMQLATNPELRAAVARWLSNDAPPTSPDAQLRDEMFLRANLRMFENQYHQNMDGTFEDSMWTGYLENMRRIFTSPAFRDFWEANRVLYSTDFSAFVDAQIRGGRGESDTA
jgi:hypothetical protein